MKIEPEPGNVLVKLPTSEWGPVPEIEKTHSSVSYGEIISMHPDDIKDKGYMIGRLGHWHKYREDIRVGRNKDHAIVELVDIKATTKIEDK